MWGWTEDKKPLGSALTVLKYKSRDGEPPVIGMNHIGAHPGGYHIDVFAAQENKTFSAGENLFDYMFETLHDFYSQGKTPRPYDAILEQHRALVAANVSRITGKAVDLDSLGADDSLPYSPAIRQWLIDGRLKKKG